MDGWMEGQMNRWVVSRKEWLSRGRIGRWEGGKAQPIWFWALTYVQLEERNSS